MSTTTKARHTSKTKAPASRSCEPWLRKNLATDPQEATQYLEVVMEDEDPRVFLLALKDVTEAYGGVGKLAEITGLNRENLYRMLSKKGNPELGSLSRVLRALGFRLKVEAVALGGRRSLVRRNGTSRARILSRSARTRKATRSGSR